MAKELDGYTIVMKGQLYGSNGRENVQTYVKKTNINLVI